MPIVVAYVCHYCFYSVADGLATLLWIPYLDDWQMLLSMWQMESHLNEVMEDVVAIVADGMATL